MNRMMRTYFALPLAALVLSGCADTWFGEADKPPLEGDRISVLVHERTVKPDVGTTDTEILLPAPSPTANWPQAGGYPNHAMHHIEVPDTLSHQWGTSIGSASTDEEKFVAAPVAADGKVFAMDAETTISAIDGTTGNKLWEVELTPDDEDDGHIGGGLAFYKGKVYATTGFAQVVAMDANTGAIVWRQSLSSPMRAAPSVRSGRIFALTVDNRLFALHADDGSTLWVYEGVSEAAAILGGGSPAIDAGVVVVPLSTGELVALRVENGRELWSQSLGGGQRTDVISDLSHIRGRPVIDRGLVLAISHSGILAAVDLRTGRRVWSREIGGIESPWVAGDFMYVLTNDSELVALSRADGRIFWVTPLPQWENPEDRDGRIVWTGPLLASDRLIVAGSTGVAMAISPYSGKILGSENMPDSVTVAPIVAGGTTYFLTEDAELSAYR